MFNPYFSQVQDALSVPEHKRTGNDLLAGLKALDGDKLLLLLLIIIFLQEGQQEEHWPLLAALIYCLM